MRTGTAAIKIISNPLHRTVFGGITNLFRNLDDRWHGDVFCCPLLGALLLVVCWHYPAGLLFWALPRQAYALAMSFSNIHAPVIARVQDCYARSFSVDS